MKKGLYLLFALAILLNSCSGNNELTGSISAPESEGKQVFLLTMKDFDSPFEPADSTIIKDGKFSFKLKSSQDQGIAYIVIKNISPDIPNGIPFVYEAGHITVTIDSIAKVKGTPMNDKCQAFFDKLGVVSRKMQAINEKANKTADETEQQQHFAEMMTLNTEASGIIFDFVKENMKNKIGEFYFIHFSQAFNEDQVKQLLAEAKPEYKAKVEEMMAMPQVNTPVSFVGQDYRDVTGPTPDGKNISLSDYIGKNKLVLIDFWASWCGPCVKEMPNVISAYNKFKSKGFEIVGVSLDETKEDWEKGIKNLGMTWPQMSDLKGWKSELSRVYQVSSIPFTLLVDENGKIIAENLRGEELHNKLQELLN